VRDLRKKISKATRWTENSSRDEGWSNAMRISYANMSNQKRFKILKNNENKS
jgi:hypothetical protein